MIGYALFNIIITILFIFMRSRPVLSAVREREIAMLLCQGRSYSRIADRLFISKHTIRNRCHSIFEKCKVRSRFELALVLGSLFAGGEPERAEGKPSIMEK